MKKTKKKNQFDAEITAFEISTIQVEDLEKLPDDLLWKVLEALDLKDRDFYDRVKKDPNDKLVKKVDGLMWIINRWMSDVTHSNFDMKVYYLQSTNLRYNKHAAKSIPAEHNKLKWLCATSISPGFGTFKHRWISSKKEETKEIKFLKNLHPTLKQDELELLAQINDRRDFEDMARKLGWDDKRIKAEL